MSYAFSKCKQKPHLVKLVLPTARFQVGGILRKSGTCIDMFHQNTISFKTSRIMTFFGRLHETIVGPI